MARSLASKRLAGVKPLFARNDRMVHGQSPLVIGQVCAHGRPEASFSQGDRWKRLISSRYIAVMPSIGRMLEPEEQNAIGGASFVAIHAMSAKVGEAARASQPAAPRACQAPVLPWFAARRLSFSGSRSIVAVPGRCRIERGCKARRKPGGSDKCDGISMNSLITGA